MSHHAAAQSASAATVDAAAPQCRNCGAALQGSYCHSCGEHAPDAHEFHLKHLLHDAIHEFLHLDGKIFRTLWLLISRPGLLTKEYLQGRRTPYIRPLRLYIVLAAIHLLLVSQSFYKVDLFLNRDSSGGLADYLRGVAEASHQTVDQVKETANRHISKAYALTQYTAVLVFALFPWLVYRRRQPHYAQHFIFALHVYAFYFLLTGVLSLFITREQWTRLTSPFPFITLAYLIVAIRRVHDESWTAAVLKGIFLRLALFATEFAALGAALAYSLFQLRSGGH